MIVYFLTVLLPIEFLMFGLQMNGLRLWSIIISIPLFFVLVTGQCGRILLTDVFLILHLLWMIVALAANNPDRVVANVGSTGVEFFGGYLVARTCIRSAGDLRRFALVFGFVLAFAILPLAIYETLTSDAPVLKVLAPITGVDSIMMEPRMGLFRAQVVFAHPILFGVFCSLALPLILVGLKGAISNTLRYLLAGATIGCAFTSLSSGALLAVMLQLFLLSWGHVMRGRRPWLLLCLGFALCYIAVDLASNRSPMRVFMSYAAFSSHNAYVRGIIFDHGLLNIWANPIVGLGLRDWTRPLWLPSSVDNFWLLTAMRYGLPGFFFLAIAWVNALWRIGRKDLTGYPRASQLRLGWMVTFVGLTFSLCTVHVWAYTFSFVFFLFGAGMWILANDLPPVSGSAPQPPQPTGRTAPQYSRFAPKAAREADQSEVRTSPPIIPASQPTQAQEPQLYARTGLRAGPSTSRFGLKK